MKTNIKDSVSKRIIDIQPYIPPKPIDELEREYGVNDISLLVSNENSMPPSANVIKAIQNEMKKANRYPEGSAIYLRKILARKLKVNPDNLVLGNGGDEVLAMICEAFLDSGEEAIIGKPSFGAYEISIRISGGKPVIMDLENHKFDLDKVLNLINNRTKIIFICNPNNPTGTIVTQKEVESFLKKVPGKVIVVFDEAYMEYVDNKEFPKSIDLMKKGYDNIIIIRTFSKIYSMAGLRIGYGIASTEIIKYLNIVRKPYNVNVLAQAAAKAALSNLNIISKSRQMNKEGKKYLYASFNKMKLNYIPTEANFILVKTGMDSKQLCDKLLYNGILVRSGAAFGYPEFIRVTIGTKKENVKFIKALSKILKI